MRQINRHALGRDRFVPYPKAADRAKRDAGDDRVCPHPRFVVDMPSDGIPAVPILVRQH
jgi:hypothetical protein